MADLGHELTDEILDDLERRMAREYAQATHDLTGKLQAYLDKFAAEDEIQRTLLDAGEITSKDYSDWRFRHIMMNKRWEDMRDTIARDYHNTNQIAAGIFRGARAGIYSLNYNYALYRIEHDAGISTGLTLYNRDAVERILKKNPQMLPPPGKKVSQRIAEGKDVRWNNQQIQSVMVQGILQGESIPKLARRLEQVTERNYTAAVRNARTMATGAQNAGRQEAYERAAKLGVDLVKEWEATLDGRTRHDHRMLHGVRVDIDEKFVTPEGELEFPGDPAGPPGEVYNCRCTTLSWVKGFEGETVKSSPKMGDMSFEEWQNAKVMTADEQSAWIKAGKPSHNEWENSPFRKAVLNRKADAEQFERYKSVLGDMAPKSLDSFQNLKYNDPEKWEYTKGLTAYLRKYPTSNKSFYDINRLVKETEFKNSVALPPVQKRAYILPSGKHDPYHIMKRMQERGITDDALRDYVSEAKVMLVQWGGERQVFIGENGCAVITKVNDEWLFRTAWSKYDNDEDMDRILEVIRNAGL